MRNIDPDEQRLAAAGTIQALLEKINRSVQRYGMSIRQTYYRRYRIWSAPNYRNLVATVWPPDSSMPLDEAITASLAEGETALIGRVRAYIDAAETAREAAKLRQRTKGARPTPDKDALPGAKAKSPKLVSGLTLPLERTGMVNTEHPSRIVSRETIPARRSALTISAAPKRASRLTP
jgi:hypothetical protein